MNKNVKIFCFFVFLSLAIAIVYKPALDNEFIGDDMYVIVHNDFVKSWDHLPRLFKHGYLSSLPSLEMIGQGDIGSVELSYRPVREFTFFIDYAFWKLNPWGFHLTNLILHILNAILLYFLARRLELKSMAAGFAALVFLFHPINSEVVAVIYARSDSLAFLFFGLALICYQNFRNSGYHKYVFYGVSLGMYFLALFSKEIAITLPLIIALYDYCFRSSKTFRERLPFYLGYASVALFYLWVWFFVMRPSSAGMVDYFYGDWVSIFATVIRILTLYLGWVLLPWGIPAALVDGAIVVRNISNPGFILLAGIIVLIVLLVVAAHQRRKYKLLFVLLWSSITVLPVMVLPCMFNMLYAARFVYIPMIGFCFALGYVWDAAQKKYSRQTILYCVGAGLLIFYTCVTMRQLSIWHDNLTVGIERLKYYAQNTLAITNVASAFEERGMLAEAEMLYEKSVAVNPMCSDCYNWQGMLYVRSGAFDKAKQSFQQAVYVDPSFESARANLCNVFGQQGLFIESEACFKDMLVRNPMSLQAYYNLGITYVRANRKQDALKTWGEGLNIEPNNAKLQEAIEKLRE